MKHANRCPLWRMIGGSILLCGATTMRNAQAIPFPDALEQASIEVPRLDHPLDHSLLIGNGDINALIWTEAGGVSILLTKNDVWDARLDTSNDPPLPTLARIRELTARRERVSDPILPEGVRWEGPDSYHSHAYPCPRACAKLRLGGVDQEEPLWRQIRAEGEINSWERKGDVTVMRIKGRKEASNGYAFGPVGLNTSTHPRLLVRVSGSENAQVYVDVMAPEGEKVFGTGWQETPTSPEDLIFQLPEGRPIETVILYTWTEDGQMAENRFESVRLEGEDAEYAVNLALPEHPTCPASLDIQRAAVHVKGNSEELAPAQIRALADRNVFLIQSKSRPILRRLASPDLPEGSSGEKGNMAWLSQDIPGDLDWPGMSFAVAMVSQNEKTCVAIVTSLEADDPVANAVDLARSATKTDTGVLIENHEALWEQFWTKSGIQMGDPLLSRTWYQGLYFLRCVSKPGVQCPGLFASLTTDTPAWHGDYHTNYNIQQTFWGAYGANHPELAEPYERLIRQYLPRAEWMAGEIFDISGAYYPHVIFAYEPSDPSVCKNPIGRQYIHHTWGMTLGVAGFTVQPLWWHYKYDPQEDFLRKIAYPPVREVACFYAEFIEGCDGSPCVSFGPTVSPEHWGWTKDLDRNFNCSFDIAMAKYTLEAAIEGAEILGCDEKLVPKFRKALEKLPDYPKQGDIVVDVEGAPPIQYNIPVPSTPVFPGDVITWFDSHEEKTLFAKTTDGLQWNGNNATVMLAITRARLSMPDAQTWLRQEINARLRPNGTLTLNRLQPHHRFNDFGHYTEQFGATMAVTELLIQSVDDVIRIFPALPEECNASFEHLRTQGGFLVSAKRNSGVVQDVEIESLYGGPCRILVPWRSIRFRINEKPWRPVEANLDGIVTIQTEKGDRIPLRED